MPYLFYLSDLIDLHQCGVRRYVRRGNICSRTAMRRCLRLLEVLKASASAREMPMLGFSRWQLFKGLAAIVCIIGIVSFALIYFIPAPPSKVVMATAFKGASFEYYGKQYRDIFARSNVKLELRETAGGVENVALLQDPNSGVQIAFVTGGVSDGKHAPGILSLGTVYNQPYWLFYSSTEPLDRLSQLKGKRIAVGPDGSGTRLSAEKILGKGGRQFRNGYAVAVHWIGRGQGSERQESRCCVDYWLAGCDGCQILLGKS